jgi:hypothetical protein
MKLKVKKEVEEEIELELPYYCKSICYYYKVLREDLVLVILPKTDSEVMELQVGPFHSRILDDRHTQITAAEFNEVFQSTLDGMASINAL